MKSFINSFILFLFCTISYAQETADKIEYGIPKTEQFWTKKLGGESQNLGVTQDNKGVLIVANSSGFLSFNGTKWVSFKPENDGVPISFAKDKKGRIYTSGTEFIGYLEPNKKGAYQFYDLKNKLPNTVKLGFIWKTICQNDKVYFQNDKNILVYSEKKFKILSDKGFVYSLFVFEKEVYVSTLNGLYTIIENKLNLLQS